MTARRKAALKKAQLASARKRRRRRAAAGVVAGTLALGAGAYAVHVGKERRWRKVNGIDYSIRRVVLTDRYRTRKKLKRLQTKIDKITTDLIQILARLTNRDEAGRHFTTTVSHDDLDALEADGLIEITRPVPATGLQYDEQHWSFEVTAAGIVLVENA